MKKEFWRDWKKITAVEDQAIKAVRKAKRTLLSKIGEKNIYAIYIKGSFVRREMNEKSDVDIVPIVFDNKMLNPILELDKTYGNAYRPAELLPISLWELKNRKRYYARKEKGPKGRPAINQFIRYKLIWGKELNFCDYPPRSNKNRLKGLIHAWNNIFIPLYEKESFNFDQIVKQVFWITEYEQLTKGSEHSHSWRELAKSVSDENHVVHDALKYRQKPLKDKKIQAQFITRVKKYLKRLERLVK